MEIIDLCGQWQVTQLGRKGSIPATVPGCVHTDLMAAGAIGDPFYRDDELELQWIGRETWKYRRAFDVPASVAGSRKILLRCESLDTVAPVESMTVTDLRRKLLVRSLVDTYR